MSRYEGELKVGCDYNTIYMEEEGQLRAVTKREKETPITHTREEEEKTFYLAILNDGSIHSYDNRPQFCDINNVTAIKKITVKYTLGEFDE